MFTVALATPHWGRRGGRQLVAIYTVATTFRVGEGRFVAVYAVATISNQRPASRVASRTLVVCSRLQ